MARTSLKEKQRWMRERHAPEQAADDLREAGVYAFERHYTVSELSEVWGLSRDFVARLFENEPGVLVFGNDGREGTRRYMTMRIPRSVAERVYRRHVRCER